MTFEQLHVFITAVQSRTFLEAAEHLHITQSNLSKQIQKLENELGVTLFDRSKRKATLNDAGQYFFSQVQKLYFDYCETVNHLQSMKAKSLNTIRIGVLPVLNQYKLTGYFRSFREKYPIYPIYLEELEERDIVTRLEQGYLDFIITRPNILADKQHIHTQTLLNDELVVILPSDHPLSKQTAVSLKQLRHENFILMNPYTAIYQLCMDMFAKENIKPHIVRCARIETIISEISEHSGISLLAKSSLNVFQHEKISMVPLTHPVKLPLVIAYRNDSPISNATQICINYLTELIKN